MSGAVEDDETDLYEGQTIDNSSGVADPEGGRIKLSTLMEIRREMSRCYRSVKRGQLEESAATKRVYILGEIGKIIRDAELEKRVMELEDRAGAGGTLALPNHSTFN